MTPSTIETPEHSSSSVGTPSLFRKHRARAVRHAFGLAAIGALMLAQASASAQTLYQVTALGTLPGATVSEAFDINDLGQVVGQASLGSTNLQAFYWTQATGMVAVGDLAGGRVESGAYGINNLGQVVGYSHTANGDRPFLWTPGAALQDLGAFSGRDINGPRARAINDSSVVTGAEAQGGTRAFQWTASTGLTDIGTLTPAGSGRSDHAYDINNAGQIVGESGANQPFLRLADGTLLDLGDLGTGAGAAYGINNLGQVVGTSGSGDRAFIWTSTGGMQELAASGAGWSNSQANEINDAGVAVGDAIINSAATAFVWTAATGMVDLNTLIDPNDPLYGLVDLNRASAINNLGQIVGIGSFDGQGTALAYLLTPVPEPHALMLVLAGLLPVWRRRSRAGEPGARASR
jgi:probable HAF family extracellular repeat protein